jgi:hypothetical protein
MGSPQVQVKEFELEFAMASVNRKTHINNPITSIHNSYTTNTLTLVVKLIILV